MVPSSFRRLKLGEYSDTGLNIKKDLATSTLTPTKTRASTHSGVVKAPLKWLLLALLMLVLSPLFLILIGSSYLGFALAYCFGIIATLISVLAVFEDQRRMRSPSYSLNKNFRKISAILYSGSSFVVVFYIVMVAFNAARK